MRVNSAQIVKLHAASAAVLQQFPENRKRSPQVAPAQSRRRQMVNRPFADDQAAAQSDEFAAFIFGAVTDKIFSGLLEKIF